MEDQETRKGVQAVPRTGEGVEQDLFSKAITALARGDAEATKCAMRSLVNGTVGFEGLAKETGIPSKSLHRMLSRKGNPSLGNLCRVLALLSGQLSVRIAPKPAVEGGRGG